MKSFNIFVLFIIFLSTIHLQAQWEFCNNGVVPSETGINVYEMTSRGNDIIISNKGIIYISSDYGENWVEKNSGLTGFRITALASDGTNIFAGAFGGGLFLSTDNGESWHPKNEGMTNDTIRAIGIFADNIFVGTKNGIFLSTNNGESWILKNSGMLSFNATYFAKNDDYIIAGTDGGIFVSTDNADNWVQKNKGLTSPYVNAVVVIGTNIFAATQGQGVFVSKNKCELWSQEITGMTNTFVFGFIKYETALFAGTLQSGIFVSSDSAKMWTKFNSGIMSAAIYTFAISGQYIFAGTYDGVFRAKLSDMITDVNEDNNNINAQIFPNPATDYIEIYYPNVETGLRTVSTGLIEIYNTLGECVKSNQIPIPETQYPNPHIKVDVSDLETGVYYLRIGNNIKKIAVIK